MSNCVSRLTIALVVLIGALALLPAAMISAARAAEGDPFLDQCFSPGVLAPCTQISPSFEGIDVEVTPDGKHVYMLGRNPALIRLFDRGANNKLTPRPGGEGCYNTAGASDCTIVPGFSGSFPYDLTISPDGRSIYATIGAALVSLQRNPDTGVLTPGPCYGTNSGCTSIAPVAETWTVVVSKDGQSVYTRGGGTFGVFQRDTNSGALILEPDGEDCFSETVRTNCTDTYGLAGNAFEMVFSPDGKFLYYPIQSPGGIGFFQRSANGTLTQISGPQGGCITTNGSSSAGGECATPPDGSGPAMGNGLATTISPSGKHVLISSSSGTIVFSRSLDDGKMTKVACIAPSAITGCQVRRGSAGMGAEVSPDGKRVVVGSADIGGVGVYNFNDTTGALTQLPDPFGCFAVSTAGCSKFPGGLDRGKVAWAPDGLNFYAVVSSPLVNILLDFAPTCDAKTAAVPFNTSALVNLSCSDVNGDAISSLNISSAPVAGNLAAIDQMAKTVRYNPFSGFTGTDSFGYTATARGVTGAEAKVTLSVEAPPPPPPPPPSTDADKDGVPVPQDCNDTNPGIRPGAIDVPNNGVDEDCTGGDLIAKISSGVGHAWRAFPRYTTVSSLSVKNAPAGSTVEVRCTGKGCKFKSKKIAVKKAGTVNLAKYFNKTKRRKGSRKKRKILSKLRVGAVIEVRITQAPAIGKVVRFKVRKGKIPSVTELCLPPAASAPVAC